MTVVVYCPTSSSLYEDRHSFRRQLESATTADKVRIKPLNKKQKKGRSHEAVIVRVEHDEHCKYEARLSGSEQSSLPCLLNRIMLLIESVQLQRTLLCAAESQPHDVQMPLFDQDMLDETDHFTPFPRALRAMPRALMLGRVIGALIAERDLTQAEVAEEVYVDEDFLSDLIAGELPEELIEDNLLVDLAGVLKVTPNTLRITLRRPVVHMTTAGHVENDLPEQYLSNVWDECDQDD